MCALAISVNRRYLAVSERAEMATIAVLDLHHEPAKRKRKVLSAGDVAAQEFVCVAFSPDSKHLIGQTGAPEWTLIFWLWEKHKILATVKTSTSNNPVKQVSRTRPTTAFGSQPGVLHVSMRSWSPSVRLPGQLQPFQPHADLRERRRRLQAVPLHAGMPETEQLRKGGLHQPPEPRLGGGRACGGGHNHGPAAGV